MTDQGNNVEYQIDPDLLPAHPVPKADQWHATDSYGESVAMYRVGNKVYPMVKVLKCKTCNSNYRSEVENDVLRSISYNKIAADLPEDADLTGRNIMDHKRKNHMPVEVQIVREIAEARAQQLGLDIMDYGSTLADYLTLGFTVISKVYQALATGKIEADLDHALQFARLIQSAEAVAGPDIDQEVVYRVFVEYQETVKTLTSDDQYQQFVRSVSTNAVIRAMIERKEQEDIIDVGSGDEEEESDNPV